METIRREKASTIIKQSNQNLKDTDNLDTASRKEPYTSATAEH